MSISKFSKDALMVFPSHKVIAELDVSEQTTANKSIEKVIKRLEMLGVLNAHIIADNSLAVEGYNILKTTDIKPYVYDVLPPLGKRIIISHMLSNNEERNKLIEGTFPRLEEPYNENEMSATETAIMNILNTSFSELLVSEDIPRERKIRIISIVSALTFFRLDYDEKDLMLYESEYYTFLHLNALTDELFRERILSDLDYYWDWANERLAENRNKVSTYSLMLDNMVDKWNGSELGDDDDIIDKEAREIFDVLRLMEKQATPEQQQQVKSRVELKLNRQALQDSHTNRAEQNAVTLTDIKTPTLYEAFQTMTPEEIRKNAELNAQLNMFIKEVEHYTILNVKALKHKYNLIINFYISQSTRLFKAMDIKGENKILLNVDLKTGYVDALFQGQPFRLNGFFNRDEEIKVNVLEW